MNTDGFKAELDRLGKNIDSKFGEYSTHGLISTYEQLHLQTRGFIKHHTNS
jgi:hypothetical protein